MLTCFSYVCEEQSAELAEETKPHQTERATTS